MLPAALSSPRRPRLRIAALAAAALIAVAALEAMLLLGQRERALDDARERADDLALVLREHLRGSFALAETSLRQLAIHARRAGGAGAPASEWDPILEASAAALPGRGSISVLDAAGTIRHTTQPVIAGESRRDTLLFRELSTGSGPDVFVDQPFPARVDPLRYVIPIGARLERADGTFDGAVVATIPAEDFRPFFRSVNVGRHGGVAVLHPAGAVMAREPSEADPAGERAEFHVVLQAARHSASGVVTGPIEAGSPPAITAFRTLAAPPIVVAVSLDEAEVLAPWRRDARTAALAFGALAMTLMGLVAVVFRQMDARALVEAELAEVLRQESVRLKESNERLAEALGREQKARHEVEQASYLKDEFLMTVSHELRTPLTAIHGWLHMLGMPGVAPDERSRALAAAERSARVQTRLVDDLLDVSRSITGKLRLDPRPASLAEIIDGAVESFQAAIAAKAIHFERQIEPGLPAVTVDADRIQQVVWNLLSNAIKFTPPRGTVKISVRPLGEHLEIQVSDTGDGIAPEFLPHVFERFRQADQGTRRRYGGLGLGLAIARHIVELHGGTIHAFSGGQGKGATFTVSLPVTAADDTVRTELSESRGSSAEPTGSGVAGTKL